MRPRDSTSGSSGNSGSSGSDASDSEDETLFELSKHELNSDDSSDDSSGDDDDEEASGDDSSSSDDGESDKAPAPAIVTPSTTAPLRSVSKAEEFIPFSLETVAAAAPATQGVQPLLGWSDAPWKTREYSANRHLACVARAVVSSRSLFLAGSNVFLSLAGCTRRLRTSTRGSGRPRPKSRCAKA